ncbi:MAG: hypothetical protein Q8L78_06840 [Coxiellaceae bacterium]|nr:hypothetical protein [Coxiellaceae bacterium]
MYSYYSMQRKHWSAMVTLGVKKNGVNCKVRIDFSTPNAVDFKEVLHYHRSYSSDLSCIGHSNLFEAFVRLSFDDLDKLLSLLSHVLEPLGCHGGGILSWVDAEIKKIQLVKSHANNPQILMAAPRATVGQGGAPILIAKL